MVGGPLCPQENEPVDAINHRWLDGLDLRDLIGGGAQRVDVVEHQLNHVTRRLHKDGCDTGGVLIHVWVDAWQMQCCGTPFADGDRIEWTLSPQIDGAWLESVVADEPARQVDFSWDKHGPHPEGSATTKGVVTSIEAVRCKLATMVGGDPNMHYPVEGSGQLQVVHAADGWERDEDGLSFGGYIVTVDVVARSMGRISGLSNPKSSPKFRRLSRQDQHVRLPDGAK